MGNVMNKLREMKTDEERWKLLMALGNAYLVVMLDNDDTFIVDSSDEDADPVSFNGYIGNGPGIEDLLAAMGIECQGV